MFDEYVTDDVPQDARLQKMHDWVSADNRVAELNQQIRKLQAELQEVSTVRSKLGRQLSEVVYPSEKACLPTEEADW